MQSKNKWRIECQSTLNGTNSNRALTAGAQQNHAVTRTGFPHRDQTFQRLTIGSNQITRSLLPTPWTQIGIIWTIWSLFRNDKFFDGVWEKTSEGRETRKRSHSHTAAVHRIIRGIERERWDCKVTKRGSKQERGEGVKSKKAKTWGHFIQMWASCQENHGRHPTGLYFYFTSSERNNPRHFEWKSKVRWKSKLDGHVMEHMKWSSFTNLEHTVQYITYGTEVYLHVSGSCEV